METTLTKFKMELGLINNEIKKLQNQSFSINTKLHNREVLLNIYIYIYIYIYIIFFSNYFIIIYAIIKIISIFFIYSFMLYYCIINRKFKKNLKN